MGLSAGNGTAFRIYAIVAIVAGAYGLNHWLRIASAPPEVELPGWSLKDMPYEMGHWHGNDVEMDPSITEATGADLVVNRAFRSDSGHHMSLHSAMFRDPAEGVYHTPLNCYAANGWLKVSEETIRVKVADDWSIDVSLVSFKKGEGTVLVAYWYQLGRHILFSRLDLGSRVRWEMRGNKVWPAMFKVMIQADLVSPGATRAAILDFAEQIGRWLNGPEHQTYLSRWGGGDNI